MDTALIVPRVVKVKSGGREYEVMRGVIVVGGVRKIGTEFIKNPEKANESVLQRLIENGKEIWSFKEYAKKYDHKSYARIINIEVVGYCIVLEYWGVLEVMPIANILKGIEPSLQEAIRLKKYVADIRRDRPLFSDEEAKLLS